MNRNIKSQSVFQQNDFVYNWGGYNFKNKNITVFDTTLRDGLQCPHSKKQPTLAEKINFLQLASEVGIEAMEIGMPVTSEAHKNEVIEIAKFVVKNKLPLSLSCLSRTIEADILAIADVSDKSGCPMTINFLIGSSKIRRLVEDWNLQEMGKWIKNSIRLARKYNLNVEFVTEDTTRSDPKTLSFLYKTAINENVKRVWIADTVGEVTPDSAQKITKFFIKNIFQGKKIGLDWHGHDDKGLGVANALAALQVGADRVQATALGVGERAGNTPMEPLLINLVLYANKKYNLKKLKEYSLCAAKMFGIPIRENYPGIGKYVHATAAGMHAAAIYKARKIGRQDLEGIVYAPFHAGIFNKEVEIYIGPMSGKANVLWNLNKLNVIISEEKINKILKFAKDQNKIITHEEFKKLLSDFK